MTDTSIPKGLVIDFEFQSLIPPLGDDEFICLEKSILAEGVRDPIITWNGTIIDGHNRYTICQKHGIKFNTAPRKFASRDAAKIWIIENQFGRRNLSKYDRSVLALQLEPLYAAEAKRVHAANGGDKKSDEYRESALQNSVKPISQPHFHTDEQLAKLAGTSRDTIRKVKVIEAEAANGNETAIVARDAVKDGKKSINAAYMDVRPKSDKADKRPICTICGKPIDEGDSYDHNRFKHKSCAMRDTEDNRGKRGGRPGARMKNADHDLMNNTPTYTTETLMAELTACAEDLRAAWLQSIAINESVGVVLTAGQRKQLDDAMENLFDTIKEIGQSND